METRANYIAVGVLTLVALLAAFFFIYWVGNYDNRSDNATLDVRIQGSVSGLGVGSVVEFNGIKVGRVVALELDTADPRFVIAKTSLRGDVPIRNDTRASIGLRGLSGGAFIQLEGGSPNAPALFDQGLADGATPLINGDPSTVSELLSRVNAIAARTERVMDGLEELVKNNSAGVTATIKNAETFTKALADNSDGVDRLLSSAEGMAKAVEKLSGKLDGTISRTEEIVLAIDPKQVRQSVSDITATVASARQILETVDPAKVASMVSNLNNASKKANELLAVIDAGALEKTFNNASKTVSDAQQIMASIKPDVVRKTVDDIAATASSARGLIDNIDQNALRSLVADMGTASQKVTQLLAAIDPVKVNKAMDQIAGAAEGAQQVVKDVSKVTSRIGQRAPEIDQMITDASQLAAQLNASSKKIDGVIERVNKLLGSNDADGLMAEARTTLVAFRKAATNFDVQINSVARGINRFTGRGLADTQGLISAARRSINRIDRVIGNIERNPASLITGGGSSIPESGRGRARR